MYQALTPIIIQTCHKVSLISYALDLHSEGLRLKSLPVPPISSSFPWFSKSFQGHIETVHWTAQDHFLSSHIQFLICDLLHRSTLYSLHIFIYIFIYFNCKWDFTRWQWYCKKTQHTNRKHRNTTEHNTNTPAGFNSCVLVLKLLSRVHNAILRKIPDDGVILIVLHHRQNSLE
jgi:hypothetical protein